MGLMECAHRQRVGYYTKGKGKGPGSIRQGGYAKRGWREPASRGVKDLENWGANTSQDKEYVRAYPGARPGAKGRTRDATRQQDEEKGATGASNGNGQGLAPKDRGAIDGVEQLAREGQEKVALVPEADGYDADWMGGYGASED